MAREQSTLSLRPARRGPGFLFYAALVVGVVVTVILSQRGERWLRLLLIYLSKAAWARRMVGRHGLAWRVASRFVAGETLDEAVQVSQALNQRGLLVTLDYLGESVTEAAVATAARDEILRALDRIHQAGIQGNVSVKLSQLGVKINPDLARQNLRAIAERARQYDTFVRIDMEESSLVDTTLQIYRAIRDEVGLPNVGVVIQAYLFRSEKDVEQLIEEGASVRLCKGAYAEPPDVAFPVKADVDAHYVRLVHLLLSEQARQKGVRLAVASHDEKMINAAIAYAHKHHLPVKEFEFQMLHGIRRDLQESLVERGYRVRTYVPYGTAWYPYFVRRLAERPANLWFFVSNFFK
ncbi:MAG: proline dehydrogenase family protein [Chloroflexota bacterium]